MQTETLNIDDVLSSLEFGTFKAYPPNDRDDLGQAITALRDSMVWVQAAINERNALPGEVYGVLPDTCRALASTIAPLSFAASVSLNKLAAASDDEDHVLLVNHWRSDTWPNLESVRSQLRGLNPYLAKSLAQPIESAKKPAKLNDRQRAVLEIIREHGLIAEKQIEGRLKGTGNECAAGTVRKHDIPVLKEHYNVKNDGQGYYIA